MLFYSFLFVREKLIAHDPLCKTNVINARFERLNCLLIKKGQEKSIYKLDKNFNNKSGTLVIKIGRKGA